MFSKIILIGNYLPDNQESMIRFTQLLKKEFSKQGVDTEIWWPTVVVGNIVKSTSTGIGKWLGYLDKYLIFPVVLKFRMMNSRLKNPAVKFHICDHSNAPYLKYLPSAQTSITCHDVIAIRGALGYSDSYQPASVMGKYLQKWIMGHLKFATSIAFVSQHSFDQFRELVPALLTKKNWCVIYTSFNNDFKPMDKIVAREKVIAAGINADIPFLLHVGSSSIRKNRALLLDMANQLNSRQKINICYAGESLDKELIAHANTIGLSPQVISIVKPDHQTLIALYSMCAAFIFPSLSEGFGMPLIEAQACGAVVIASSNNPMPEVSGGAALHYNPKNPQDFACGFETLKNEGLRQQLIQEGFKNCLRYQGIIMIKQYQDFINLN